MTRVSLALVITLVTVVAGACGSDQRPGAVIPTGLTTSPEDRGGATGPGPMDWNNPILGVPVPSLSDATAAISFEPLIPESLGGASKILVQLGVPDVERRVAAFMFNHKAHGLVVLMEWKPVGSPEEYEARLHTLPARAAAAGGGPNSGHADLVSIRGGILAVLTEPDDRSIAALRWVEDGIVIDLGGPNLQRDEVISIANAL